MKRSLPLALAVLTLTLRAVAENVCPCVPTTHLWIVQSRDTRDCAASEFVVSARSPDTMVMPTSKRIRTLRSD